MKDCDVIQPELSAYVDGELTPHRRELVEAHLASCPRCQEALAQLKTLTVGVAALPKLQPSPRFLVEVRRKIARGDRPEALTWHDHLFRPFWLKVPLELAALVAVTVLVTRLKEQPAVETVVSDQLAQAENSGNDQSPAAEIEAKPEQPAAMEPAPAPQPPSPAAVPENEVATAPAGEPTPSQEAATTTENGNESAGDVAVNRGTVGLGITPIPSAAEVSTLARNVGIEPSKLGGVVVVRSRDLNEVQGRAEQLAARCNGKVISVPPSMGSTGQIFFVEVPREYAASFKLDLEQNAASSSPSTNALVAGVAVFTTNASPLSATSTARVVGVLTGGIETNVAFNGSGQLTLANNPRAQAAATTVLEILVVAPPSLAPTNTTSVPATPAN